MQILEIRNFGPISECKLEIDDFVVLTGVQASGKSTIAKSVFFFNNIKNLLYQLVGRIVSRIEEDTMEIPLAQRLKREIRNNFLQIFGTTMALDSQMNMKYRYENGETIEISLTDTSAQRKFADIYIGRGIWENIYRLEDSIKLGLVPEQSEYKTIIDRDIFCNELEVVYIPAGRSLITLLSSQINYLYSTMDDVQKRSIDYCTQNYLERILRLKPFFTGGYKQIVDEYKSTSDKLLDQEVLSMAADICRQILKGEYRNVFGEERLQISDDHYVKINFASSGQQEAVWILNVLFYYLLNKTKTYFIIEEPESHLFPAAQKRIVEYISLVKNKHNKVIITTHSPYVLGSINNLLYANYLSNKVDKDKLCEIISPQLWVDFKMFGAYYLAEGQLKDIKDPELENMDHDVIDGVSIDINEDFEKMVALKFEMEGM